MLSTVLLLYSLGVVVAYDWESGSLMRTLQSAGKSDVGLMLRPP